MQKVNYITAFRAETKARKFEPFGFLPKSLKKCIFSNTSRDIFSAIKQTRKI
jgi:hypothetical protein